MNDSTRREFLAKMKARLDKLGEQIETMKGKSGKQEAQALQEHENRLHELREKRRDAKRKINDLHAASDQINTDPDELVLDPDSGRTPVLRLAPDSPALDAGIATDASFFDGRGEGFRRTEELERPNAPGSDGTDIGAFELRGPFLFRSRFESDYGSSEQLRSERVSAGPALVAVRPWPLASRRPK